jgi:hypothetical protein
MKPHLASAIGTGLRVHKRTFTETVERIIHKTWGRVLVEELTGFQLVKKFPTFYGTGRFIAAFTRDHHLSAS